MKKNMEGITLVSLVITIIVMLILAGVSIQMATGDSGVLTRASDSALKTKLSKVFEDFTLGVSDVEMQYQNAWAENSSIAAYKGVFHTTKKLNETFKEMKILDASNGTGKIVTDNFSKTQKSMIGNGYKTAIENSGIEKYVYTDEHPISQLAFATNTTPTITKLKDPGKNVYFTMYLSDGVDEKTLGSNTYVAVCYIEDGIPTLVDLGLVENGVDTALKNGILSSNLSGGKFSKPSSGVQISGLTDVSWYNHAKGLIDYKSSEPQE